MKIHLIAKEPMIANHEGFHLLDYIKYLPIINPTIQATIPTPYNYFASSWQIPVFQAPVYHGCG